MWIDEPPKDVIALINETAELRCVAKGDPQPTVTWKKDGSALDISNSRFHPKSSGTLQISNAKKSDSGRYVCIASNVHGKQNESATLRVLSKYVTDWGVVRCSATLRVLSKYVTDWGVVRCSATLRVLSKYVTDWGVVRCSQ